MNYYKLAMQVFKQHGPYFVTIAQKRANLKQKLILKRRYNQPIPDEDITILETEIKKGVDRINELIGSFLK